jgi:uncharacterized protein
MSSEYLPFWHFFQAIDKLLSYERWIDKYKLFVNALYSGHIAYDPQFVHFKKFCKVLYLQDYRDEKKFEQLLDTAIQREQEWLLLLLNSEWAERIKKAVGPNPLTNGGAQQQPEAVPEPPVEPDESVVPEMAGEELEHAEKPAKPEEKTRYYNPFTNTFPDMPAAVYQGNGVLKYLHTDEYFSVTRRQMVKGWQFLRYKEKSVYTSEIDIAATILSIARAGLFLEPAFVRGTRNREDTLIIFADVRGSMTPFHELTNRLIQTAKKDGGHPRAPVYYFQNVPADYLYKQSNLAMPVKIKEAFQKANSNSTIAIVISDAGAARGNPDENKRNARVKATQQFLRIINDSCRHIIWFNPMPVHRWAQSAADTLKNDVLIMAPVLDSDTYNFQDTLRTIFKVNQ